MMCRMAWEDGVTVMAATPHVFNGVYEHTLADIQAQMASLQERLAHEEIPIEIVQGAEVFCRPDLPSLLEENPELTINGGKRFFLLEFPRSIIPPNIDQLIVQLVTRNQIPIIVHPERNLYIQANLEFLEELVRDGALCQITAMSVTGDFGPRAAQCAHELLRRDCVHVIASDTHGMKARPPILSRAREAVSRQLGAPRARELFEIFPEKIVNGQL